MATKKPRFSVTFTEEVNAKIRAYQERERISTTSKAVARLVDLALDTLEIKTASLKSDEAAQLLDDYIGLDPHGRRMVRLVAGEEKDRMKRG